MHSRKDHKMRRGLSGLVFAAVLSGFAVACSGKPAGFAPFQMKHSDKSDPSTWTVQIQGHVRNLEYASGQTGQDDREHLVSFELDKAYVILLDEQTRWKSTGSKTIAIQEGDFVQVAVRSHSFTTSTQCIPKWAARADQVIPFSDSGPYAFRELVPFVGVILSIKELPDGSAVASIRGKDQNFKLILNSRTTYARGGLSEARPGMQVSGWMAFEGAAYEQYLERIRDPDLCDVPPEFYREYSRTAVQIFLSPARPAP